MDEFETKKIDAMLWAFAAVNLAIVRQLVRATPEPGAATSSMRATALRLLDGAGDVLAPPADAIARTLVETVFLQ